MSKWLLSAPTVFGLESLAADEIRALGYQIDKVEDGRVAFWGDEAAICRANLWLRTAERVQVKLGDFGATSFTELFDSTKALPWPDLLPADAVFPVQGHCLSSKLASVPDCQAIIKKAAVESMKNKWKTGWFSESGALYRINFNIIRDRVTIYVDTSGDGLHKRGYREEATITPLKETLAAALVKLSGWRPGKALWDPFCGSGTIAIEAAMIAANRAPGLTRGFAAEGWDMPCDGRVGGAFRKLWDEERAKAMDKYNNSYDSLISGQKPIEIAGSDISRHCVRTAVQNAKTAGVSKLVRFFQLDAKDMGIKHSKLHELGLRFPEKGCVVSNPPYGERDDNRAGALDVCREWGPALAGFRHWGWCVISALDDFERGIGRTAYKRRKLNNGKIKCRAYLYKPERVIVD